MRLRRLFLIVIGLVIIVPIAVILIMVARFNPNRYKPQIIAAIEGATHRQVSITGPLRMGIAFTPTITASGITVANPAGFPTTTLLSLPRLQAQVWLLPLLSGSVDIIALRLIDPVITLERNQTGIGNWVVAPNRGSSGLSSALAHRQSSAPRHRHIALQSVSVINATIVIDPTPALIGGKPSNSAPDIIKISRFTGHAANLDSRLHLAMTANINGHVLALAGKIGPVGRLLNGQAGSAATAWPVDLTLHGAGGDLSLHGSIAHPTTARGIALTLNGQVANLAALNAYGFGAALPALQNLKLAADISLSQPGAMPDITHAAISAGASDLSAIRPGLRLTALTATMPALDQAVALNVSGTQSGQKIAVNGTIGPLGPLLAGKFSPSPLVPTKPAKPTPTPLQINLTGSAAAATASLQGTINHPQTLSGVDVQIHAQTPDLSQTGALFGANLPKLTHLAVAGLLTDPHGQGLRHALALDQVAITADQAQLAGAATVNFGKIPDIQAVINAPRLDLTTLRAAFAAPPNITNPAPGPAPGAAPAPSHSGSTGLIPNTALPFNLLHQADFNIELSINHVQDGKTDYRAVVAHALLNQGVLVIRPMDAQTQGGAVSAQMSVNSNATPPHLTFSGQAPAFRLQSLLRLFGVQGAHNTTGTAQIYVDLAGSGETAHGIASRLNGAVGISAVNGVIGGAALGQAIKPVLAGVGMPSGAISQPGPVALRCFAARLNARQGIVGLSAFTLDSSRLALTGTGNLSLRAERLNLVFLPTLRVGASSLPVAVGVTGPFAHPRAGLASPGAYRGAASALVQRFGAPQTRSILGDVTNALGMTKNANPQSCRVALLQARMGHPGLPPGPGFASAQPGQTQRQSKPILQGPQNLLNSLFK